jgi:hypothetical protein
MSKRKRNKLDQQLRSKGIKPLGLTPGDVKAVTINGRERVLVVGREYKFTLKEGCSPVLVDDEPRP